MADDLKKPEDEKTTTENKSPAIEPPTDNKATSNPDDNVIKGDFNTKNQEAQSQSEKQKTHKKKPQEVLLPDKQPAQRNSTPKTEKITIPNKEPKADKPEPKPKPDKSAKERPGANVGSTKKSAVEEKPKAATNTAKEPDKSLSPDPSPEPKEAPRIGEQEKIVYINLSEITHSKDILSK